MTAASYLHAMGIVTWRARASSESAATISCYGYHLFNAKSRWVACCIAESGHNTLHEQRLWQSIARALGMQTQGEFYSEPPDITEIARQVKVIVMGKVLASFYANESLIVTHGLNELLSEPLLKRDTWRDLQPIVRIL